MVEDSKLAQVIPFLKYSNPPLLLICAISDYQPVILGCNSCLHFGAKHAKQMLCKKCWYSTKQVLSCMFHAIKV